MSRIGLKKMLVASVAIFGLSLCAAQANAGWWWGAAPSCYGNCYGGWDCGCVSACGCYSGCNGCGCHHRACRHGCGCGCAWSSCCDTCWTPVSCSMCCGTSVSYWGSSCGCGTVVAPAAGAIEGPSMPTPAAPTPTGTPSAATPAAPSGSTPAPVPATPASPAPAAPGIPGAAIPDVPLVPPVPGKGASLEPADGESGLLTVWAPYDAKVTINGLLTKSTGSKRHFVSYGLRPGYSYKYEVKAEIVHEGKIYEVCRPFR